MEINKDYTNLIGLNWDIMKVNYKFLKLKFGKKFWCKNWKLKFIKIKI